MFSDKRDTSLDPSLFKVATHFQTDLSNRDHWTLHMSACGVSRSGILTMNPSNPCSWHPKTNELDLFKAYFHVPVGRILLIISEIS